MHSDVRRLLLPPAPSLPSRPTVCNLPLPALSGPTAASSPVHSRPSCSALSLSHLIRCHPRIVPKAIQSRVAREKFDAQRIRQPRRIQPTRLRDFCNLLPIRRGGSGGGCCGCCCFSLGPCCRLGSRDGRCLQPRSLMALRVSRGDRVSRFGEHLCLRGLRSRRVREILLDLLALHVEQLHKHTRPRSVCCCRNGDEKHGCSYPPGPPPGVPRTRTWACTSLASSSLPCE